VKTERKTKVEKSAKCSQKRSKHTDVDDPATPECSSDEEADPNKCVECWENNVVTTKKDDWLECVLCKTWMHESCTTYANKCNDSGRKIARKGR
jgi:hypothetical protein